MITTRLIVECILLGILIGFIVTEIIKRKQN